MRQVVIDAPAKVNLGLEVIGRRDDGFHDIRSVMAMLELSDCLVVFEDDGESNAEVDGVAGPENLIRKALVRFRAVVPGSRPLGWRIEKRIPAAAGLGGASSDAAAALIAANLLADEALSTHRLHALAADLGSDVPFFLGAPAAIASGRGTDLIPLPPVSGEVILVVPDVILEAKTQSMYGALRREDFGDGSDADLVRDALDAGRIPSSRMLRNSFSRAAGERIPELLSMWESLEQVNFGSFGLTGAGPATYVLVDGGRDPNDIARSLRAAMPPGLRIFQTRFRKEPMTARLEHLS